MPYNCITSLPVIKEASNPLLFPLFVELICSDTQREAPVLGAKYKRLVLPRSPVCEGSINWGSNKYRSYKLPVSVARRLLPLHEGWLQTFRVSDGASRLTKVTLSWTCPVFTPVMVHKQEIFPG